MRYSAWALWAAAVLLGSQSVSAEPPPVRLALQPDPETVYAPPRVPRVADGINEGGVHLDLGAAYFNRHMFRGLQRFAEEEDGADRASFQIDGKLTFDLGKLPHPFMGVFVNIAEGDPISKFQEMRPYFGFDLEARPLTFSAGHNSYVFPDRDGFDTSEIWGRIALDDSGLFNTERPIFSPYIYGAYDYNLYNGWYLETGVRHVFDIENTDLRLIADAHVAYVRGVEVFAGDNGDSSGFHHYQLGLTADYTLNTLLNISRRYGTWSLRGYLFYVDGIDNDLRTETRFWGGAGIHFRY